MKELSNATGVKTDGISNCLTRSFHRSCDLAKEYGLQEKFLQPIVRESNDDIRDKLAREFSFYASNQNLATETEKSTVSVTKNPQPSAESAYEKGGTSAGEKPRSTDSDETPTVTSVNKRQNSNEPGVRSTEKVVRAQETKATPDSPGSTTVRGDLQKQLAIIQEITALVAEEASLNKIFIKILEGLYEGVGFDRSMLCLINPGRSHYAGRIALGDGTDSLKQYVSGSLDTKNDIFARVLMDGAELFIEDVRENSWKGLVPDTFLNDSGVSSFIMSAVRSGHKPLGFFYGDNGISQNPITDEQRRGFAQFMAQAKLALQVRN
jgi:uncharacterized protein YqgV (UPF0045/DUF77 family)